MNLWQNKISLNIEQVWKLNKIKLKFKNLSLHVSLQIFDLWNISVEGYNLIMFWILNFQ